MSPDYHKLKPLIANYVFDEKYIYSDMDKKEVTGVMLSASSLIRKQYTLNRIKNIISKDGLQLCVNEDGFETTSYFVIKNK